MTERSGGPLVFVALGGAGEIGMNCYLYGLGEGRKRRWLMVDLGVGFGDMETSPGIELVLPDLGALLAERDRLEAIVLTHGHEDHVGAIPHLWPKLKVPIYARPFCAEIVRRKFAEVGFGDDPVRVVDVGRRIEAGPFSVEWLDVTHSIPEGSMLAIRTPAGTVLHTGDFKMDPEPLLGRPFDIHAFEALGKEGVLAMACDSTNIFLPGRAGSEAEVAPNIRRLIADAPGAVAATSFASNVIRLRTLAQAAQDAGRSIVVAGRAMRQMIEMAVKTRQVPDFPPVIGEREAADIPAGNLFYLVSGSQGEARAALWRIANGTHPTVRLHEGDTVLFSTRTIPGNEAHVHRLYNRLSEQGVRVIDAEVERIHVSGHARRDDLKRLYRAIRPQVAIPIHGEHRHLVEHARSARVWGIPHAFVAPNGAVVRLDGKAPGIVEHVETGQVYLDGRVQVGALDGVIRDRLKAARNGHVVVAITVDADGELIADSEVRCLGAPRDGEGWHAPLEEMIGEAVDEAIDRAPRAARRSDSELEQIAARTARSVAVHHWGKKPVTTVIVTRLED
jgi:ribonuclease J